MKPSLLFCALLACSSPAWAGPKEQSGPGVKLPANTSAPQLVVSPVILTPAGLNPGIIAGLPLPAAASGQLPSLPRAAAQAQGADGAKTQTATKLPPKGPPNGPDTESGGGGPPGPPHNPNNDGPAPGPAGNAQNRSALAQLRTELSALQKELVSAENGIAAAGVTGKDYKGGSEEAVGRAHERLNAVKSRITEKKAEIKTARSEEKSHYKALKQEISVLKKERDAAMAEAGSMGAAHAAEFKGKGGSEEARARALEKAAALELEIESRREQVAFIERENPGFAGLRAPFVAIKKALGFAPRSAEEKRLRAEISALEKELSALAHTSERARNGVHDLPERVVGEITEAVHKRAETIDAELAAKRKELNSLPSPISANGEERRLASEIAALDKEQQRLELAALRILAGQKDAPSSEAVLTAQQAQKRAGEIRGEIELKRTQLRRSRTISRR